MKKLISSFTLFLFVSLSAFSQNVKLTVEDAVIGRWRQFYPEHLSGVQAYAENDFTHVKNYNEIILMNDSGKELKVLLKLDQINEVFKNEELQELRAFPYWNYNWVDSKRLSFTAATNYYVYNIETNNLELKSIMPQGSEHISPCTSNNLTAYTLKNNLYYVDPKANIINVTNDEDPGIVNGSANTHRHEFGIDKGIFWSPAGTFIAFYRKDESMVKDYPLVDITSRIAELKNTKYPMIGEKSEEVSLGIYNIKTGKTIFTEVNDFTSERYLTSITWGPEEKFIYIGVLNRGQDHLKVNKYDAITGKFVQTLFEEKNNKYVEPEHQLIFVKGLKDQFIWFSERDGFNHLYLYSTDGKIIRQLTAGEWAVNEFLGFDSKLKNFYITSSKESPIEDHFYKVNFKSGVMNKLTEEEGVHSIVLTNSKKYFFDSYSNKNTANKHLITDIKGKVIKEILTAENPLSDYELGEMTIGTIKSSDEKTDLYYRLITPPNFDPGKKYPVIIYVYGGPHLQLVRNSWLGGSNLWNFYMAQEGYIIYTLDNRGSDNRGFEFESIIHRHCGQEEMKDQLRGVEFLKSLPYVDKDRIGVHGWSYGGFLTTSLMINYPDIFKVGVAGGPVTDWKYYEVMYGERYMDTPKENPEGFEKVSLLNKADKLQGRLMMIHGYQDPVVVPQNSIDFIRSAVKSGTDIDYFIYPESEHNMRGQTRVHLMKKVTRYFDDFLK